VARLPRLGGTILADDALPLEESPSSHAAIVHDRPRGVVEAGASRRCGSRIDVEGVPALLTVEVERGRIDNVVVPVCDLSCTGAGVLYDRELRRGHVVVLQYFTRDERRIRVGGMVRRCHLDDGGLYRVGLFFIKPIERRALKITSPRRDSDFVIGVRPRYLHGLESAKKQSATLPSAIGTGPLVIQPTADAADADAGEYALTVD
jgi:hypothetical protein